MADQYPVDRVETLLESPDAFALSGEYAVVEARRNEGAGMNKQDRLRNYLLGAPGAWLPIIGGIGVLILSAFLSTLPISPDPLLFGQLQFASGIVAITLAGAAFVRFHGTRDRFPLILAAGFGIVGVALASSILSLPSLSSNDETASLRDPMTWVIGRTLLAILLVSALLVQERYAHSLRPIRDVVTVLLIVVMISVFLSIVHRHLPTNIVVQPGHFFPRPGNLIPAAFFLLATLSYHRRLKTESGPFHFSLYFATAINLWCSLAAAQSDHQLDETFALASVLQFSSYAIILCGTFLDNIHLFREIHRLAISDPVTGLANYRHLIDSLEVEIQRTGRTARPFALLLFDLDGLKKINDQFGHQVGTHALCRAADVLRYHSRLIDTAARHGGDEFALILPETTDQGALEVLNRICDRVASDGKQPQVSLSAGFAIFPRDGNTVESLMDAADRVLYKMKKLHKLNPSFLKKVGA
jgi:diguanylate cyclase (GGDEF)-like protein